MRPHSTTTTAAAAPRRGALPLLLCLMLAAALPMLSAIPANAASPNVDDGAGILASDETSTLEEEAERITGQYDVGVYIVTVNDYTTDGRDSDITEAAENIYNDHSYGKGSERNGIMLLLSMSGRDYALLTHGDDAKYAFSDYATGQLEQVFLDDFHDDDWYQGFADYLDACDSYLGRAKGGHPVTESGSEGLTIDLTVILLACGVSIAVCLVIRARNKSVHIGTSAAAYETAPVRLTQRVDQYTHTTRSVRHIESESSSSGGGSSVHISSGGSSVRSGKF